MDNSLFIYIYSLRDILILLSLIDCIKYIFLPSSIINTVCLILIVLGLYGLKTYNKSYLLSYGIYIIYAIIYTLINMFNSFNILLIILLVYYLWIIYCTRLLYNALYKIHDDDIKEIILFD